MGSNYLSVQIIYKPPLGWNIEAYLQEILISQFTPEHISMKQNITYYLIQYFKC